jgi:hypothetical protein
MKQQIFDTVADGKTALARGQNIFFVPQRGVLRVKFVVPGLSTSTDAFREHHIYKKTPQYLEPIGRRNPRPEGRKKGFCLSLASPLPES